MNMETSPSVCHGLVKSWIIVVIFVFGSVCQERIDLPYRNLDSLICKGPAKISRLNNSRELLGAEHVKRLAECRGEDNRGFFGGQTGAMVVRNIHKRNLKPESPLGSDRKILEDEPNARLVLVVFEAHGIGREATNQVTRGGW
jgi:hypothetical protein